MNTIDINKVKPILAKIDSTYDRRKKPAYYNVTDHARHCTSSYWNDGSRNIYHIYDFVTGAVSSCPCGRYPWTIEDLSGYVMLTDTTCLIQTGTFCGKPTSPHFNMLEPAFNKYFKPLLEA